MLRMAFATSRTRIWSSGRDSCSLVLCRSKSSVQALAGWCTQSGCRLVLRRLLNSWPLHKESWIIGCCRTGLPWAPQISSCRKTCKKRSNKTIGASLRCTTKHLTTIETKRLSRKRPCIREVKRSWILLISLLTVSWTASLVASKK